MPYIKPERRLAFDNKIALLVDALQDGNANKIASAGDLNYVITEILISALNAGYEPKYDKINTAAGVLECVKLEMYRRLAAGYEDKKIFENGDVSAYDFAFINKPHKNEEI